MRSAPALFRTRVVGAAQTTMMSNQPDHNMLELQPVGDELVPAACKRNCGEAALK